MDTAAIAAFQSRNHNRRYKGSNGSTQGSTSIASGARLNAAGQLTQLTYAPGTETRAYNALNQLTNIHLSDSLNMLYVYNAGTDNGQIAQAIDRAHGESVMYSYDSLKRLSGASASAVPAVQNQSFEQFALQNAGINEWLPNPSPASVPSDESSHSGAYSMKMLPGGGMSLGISSCTSGTTTFSLWYRALPGGALYF